MTTPQTFPSLTKPQKRLILMGLLALIGIGYYVNEQRAGAVEAGRSGGAVPAALVSPTVSPTGGRGALMGALPEDKKLTEASGPGVAAAAVETVAQPERPKPVLLADGRVRTVMAPGETLVTGGYLNTEGKWEFSMVTATVLEEGGHKQIVLSSSVLALDDKGVGRAGLSSLLTGEVETKQHGEVWKAGEAQRILKEMSGVKGTELISAPQITTLAGRECMVSIGSDDGVLIQMGGKVDLLPDGKLDVTVSHKRQAPGK